MRKILLCALFILIFAGFVSSEAVNYYHENASLKEDCFGGTCLSMPLKGPVYATSGASNWGCGPCNDVSMWVGKDAKQLAKKAKCMDGMENINGVKLCLETDNGERWDVVFNTWSSAGSSEFGYLRYNACGSEILNEGKLGISDIDFSIKGFGDENIYWYPLDEAEIEFNIENNGDWDIKDIEIKACLFDKKEANCILDEEDMDIDGDGADLDKGEDGDVTLFFTLDLDSMEDFTDYVFYVSATGEINNQGGPYDENITCGSFSQDIEVRTDEDFVIIDDIYFELDSVIAGEEALVAATVYNIGDEKIKDDDIYIRIYNNDLKLNKIIEFDNGIGSFDEEDIKLSFIIPIDTKSGSYAIDFIAYDKDKIVSKNIIENEEGDNAEYSANIIIKSAPKEETTEIVEVVEEKLEENSSYELHWDIIWTIIFEIIFVSILILLFVKFIKNK